MITCREFIEFLWAYVSGEVSAGQRFEFDAHLAVCPSCVSYLDSYRHTIELGRDAFADPDGAVPGDVPEELIRAVLAAREKR